MIFPWIYSSFVLIIGYVFPPFGQLSRSTLDPPITLTSQQVDLFSPYTLRLLLSATANCVMVLWWYVFSCFTNQYSILVISCNCSDLRCQPDFQSGCIGCGKYRPCMHVLRRLSSAKSRWHCSCLQNGEIAHTIVGIPLCSPHLAWLGRLP
jgi:hypothetical protein